MKTRLTILVVFTFLASACTPAPGQVTEPPSLPSPDAPVASPKEPAAPIPGTDYSPQPGDQALIRAEVDVQSAQIRIMESYPVQIGLDLSGALPTPCHKLRIAVDEPGEMNRINVDVYAVVEPGEMCIQVLEPFQVSLNLGSFPSGNYSIWVNGDKVGHFDA